MSHAHTAVQYAYDYGTHTRTYAQWVSKVVWTEPKLKWFGSFEIDLYFNISTVCWGMYAARRSLFVANVKRARK